MIFDRRKNSIIDRVFMHRAMELAREAANRGEIPVGAVIVKDGEIIAEGSNRREEKQNALSHAETEAIHAACQKLKSWRLDGCTLYVTLEPCPMCAGAIINSRISTVVYGAYDLNWGSMGSVTDLCNLPYDNIPDVYCGICEDECKEILTEFFRNVRK